MENIIKKAISEHKDGLKFLEANQAAIKEISSLFISTLEAGGKIIFAGNGGSAADAQHLAAELVGRFKKDRIPLAAIALSTNTSILTAIGNDFGFDEVFARQIKALAQQKDIFVGISTSGKSKNITKAVEAAKQQGIRCVGFLGRDGGDLKTRVDIALTIPHEQTPCIQEMHILAGHIICAIVEKHFLEK